MSALIHTLIIALAIGAAFIWLQIPFLLPYSGQAFAIASLIYFIVKRLSRAKVWHIVPRHASSEVTVVTFAILILVGSTGNLDSWFYPLVYLLLFFLVLACEVSTALLITALLVLFHFALTPAFTFDHLPGLLTLPLLLLCFLFAKEQYDRAKQDQLQLETNTELIREFELDDQTWHLFATNFLQPKLGLLQQLTHQPQSNQQVIQGQLTLIAVELEKMLQTKADKNLEQVLTETEL